MIKSLYLIKTQIYIFLPLDIIASIHKYVFKKHRKNVNKAINIKQGFISLRKGNQVNKIQDLSCCTSIENIKILSNNAGFKDNSLTDMKIQLILSRCIRYEKTPIPITRPITPETLIYLSVFKKFIDYCIGSMWLMNSQGRVMH